MNLLQTATHEAGHCVTAISNGYPVLEVSAVARHDTAGYSELWCPFGTFDHITIYVAGDLAVEMNGLADFQSSQCNLSGPGTDGIIVDQSANALAKKLGDNSRTKVLELIERARERAASILAQNHAAIAAIVEILMRGEIICEDHPVLKSIVRTSAPKV